MNYQLKWYTCVYSADESIPSKARIEKEKVIPGWDHPELSGCITTFSVRNTEVANFCAAMDTLIYQDGLG